MNEQEALKNAIVILASAEVQNGAPLARLRRGAGTKRSQGIRHRVEQIIAPYAKCLHSKSLLLLACRPFRALDQTHRSLDSSCAGRTDCSDHSRRACAPPHTGTTRGQQEVVHLPWTPKASENGVFPDAYFLHFPWDLPTFSDMTSYPKRPKMPFFGPEVPIQKSLSCVKKGPDQPKHPENFVNNACMCSHLTSLSAAT